jgi:prevent-host-death family protein
MDARFVPKDFILTILGRLANIAGLAMETIMHNVSSSEFQNKVGRYLDVSRREPVEISKNGQRISVLLSVEEYDILQARDDAYWVARAREAREKADSMTHEESMKWLIQSSENAGILSLNGKPE